MLHQPEALRAAKRLWLDNKHLAGAKVEMRRVSRLIRCPVRLRLTLKELLSMKMVFTSTRLGGAIRE
jgi:hypothetical protein